MRRAEGGDGLKPPRGRGLGVALLSALIAASCAGPSTRRDGADALARAGGLVPASVGAGSFEPAVWQRPVQASALTVYVEGDGAAWLDRFTPSPDPTPADPTALRLAALDPTPAVAAAGRICQHQGAASRPQPLCRDVAWWTDRRFTADALRTLNLTLDELKRRAGAQRLHLVGFSGGGTLAALAAAERPDVASLRTVAGNLSPFDVNRLHDVETPPGTLSPLDVAGKLARMPQIHFTGLRDKVTPPQIADLYADRVRRAGVNERENGPAAAACVRVVRVDAGHNDGWAERWPALAATPLPDCGR